MSGRRMTSWCHEQQHAYLAFGLCCPSKKLFEFRLIAKGVEELRIAAKDFRHSLTVHVDRARVRGRHGDIDEFQDEVCGIALLTVTLCRR
jgi:hypothetical protein